LPHDQDVDVDQDIDEIWRRIEAHAGESFALKQGGPFSYQIERGYLVPDRTNRRLPRRDIERAIAMLPLQGPGQIQHLQGPSFIYAVLMDPRIKRDDW
jgi:hypothetical protein